MVWPCTLFGVVIANQTETIDRSSGGRRLPNAWIRHFSRNYHPICRTFRVQVHLTIVAEKVKGLLLEKSQSYVLLTGQRIMI